MPKIAVEGLFKVFGPQPGRALPLLRDGRTKDEILAQTGLTVGINDASFSVEEGEMFVVMGLSGSGKSTVLRCLNRLIEPTAGRVLVDDEDITRMSAARLQEVRRRKLGMVFQRFALFPHRNVVSNVEYGLEVQGMEKGPRRERAAEALGLVGLTSYAESMPSELSGGMQQRVGLARALATDPDVLLMDEAFSALDPLIRKDIQDELLDLQARMRKTIVFITHDLDEALKLGDHIAIMKDGAIVQIGTPEDILTHPADDYVREFVQDVDRTRVITARTIMFNPDPLVLPRDGAAVAVRRMRQRRISSIFAIGANRVLRGIVRIEDAVRLAGRAEQSLESVLVTDVPTTGPDTPIRDLLPVATQTPYPIAVVDEDRRLLGIIVRATIIGGILGGAEP